MFQLYSLAPFLHFSSIGQRTLLEYFFPYFFFVFHFIHFQLRETMWFMFFFSNFGIQTNDKNLYVKIIKILLNIWLDLTVPNHIPKNVLYCTTPASPSSIYVPRALYILTKSVFGTKIQFRRKKIDNIVLLFPPFHFYVIIVHT